MSDEQTNLKIVEEMRAARTLEVIAEASKVSRHFIEVAFKSIKAEIDDMIDQALEDIAAQVSGELEVIIERVLNPQMELRGDELWLNGIKVGRIIGAEEAKKGATARVYRGVGEHASVEKRGGDLT